MGRKAYRTNGNNIKYLREQHGLSVRDLADKLDITYPSLSKLENGGEPKWSTVLMLSDFFNVTSDYLMGRSTNPNREHSPEFTGEEINLACKFIRDIRNLGVNTSQASQNTAQKAEGI